MILFSAKYKKRLISALMAGSMLLSAGAAAFASDSEELNMNTDEAAEQIVAEQITDTFETEVFSSEMFAGNTRADRLADAGAALKRLGLVVGDDKGDLMLTKVGTRAEAMTLFVRLCGEFSESQSADWSYTFKDVPGWSAKVVGYSVYKGYTAGYSDTQFASSEAVTLDQFMSFVLRALGYEDYIDFTWKNASDFAVTAGICTREEVNKWKSAPFRRQEIMEICYLALSANLKNSSATMADKLVARGQLDAASAANEGVILSCSYEAQSNGSNTVNFEYASVIGGTYELHNAAKGTVMTADGAKQADAVLKADTNASNQLFRVVNNNDGTFRMVSTVNQTLAVDANSPDTILWSINGTDCQNFIAVAAANGKYFIRSAAHPEKALTAVNSDVRMADYTGGTEQMWSFSDNTENTALASEKLASIMQVYPNGTSLGSGYRFADASQCMGFGREVFYRMYGSVARWGYDGSPKSSADAALYKITGSSKSYSAANMKNLISKAKPGDILQMNTPKMHTMVFVSKDDSGFTVYDANWTGPNKVSLRKVSYGAWTSRNSSGITLLHANAYPS